MAEVRVFVDDAVLGRLPDVCASTGVIARGRLRCTTPVGGSTHSGIVWVLLLVAGPIGWAVAFVLMLRRSEQLDIELPYSDDAYDELVSRRRSSTVGFLVAVAGVVAAFLLNARISLNDLQLAAVLAAPMIGLVVAAVARFRLWRQSIGIELDGSRRWVRLTNVHPAFARACTDSHDRTMTGGRSTLH